MGKTEDRLQHLNNVLEGVLFIIQDDDVIELAEVVLRGLTGFGLYCASRHSFILSPEFADGRINPRSGLLILRQAAEYVSQRELGIIAYE